MDNLFEPLAANQPTTGEPVTNQAPAVPATLPDGYGDFMEVTPDGKRFPKPDYIINYSRQLANALTNGTPALSASAFRTAFLRDAKKALRRNAPVGLMLATAASFEVQAIKLVAKHKAPAILEDMMHALVAAVVDAETYQAAYNHLDSVYTFMLQIESQKGGDN